MEGLYVVLGIVALLAAAVVMAKLERKRATRDLKQLYEEFPEDKALAYQIFTQKDMTIYKARDLLQRHRRAVEKAVDEATGTDEFMRTKDQQASARATGDLLRLRKENNKLRADLEDWYEMSNGMKSPVHIDLYREHLVYLFDEHGLERRDP